MQIFASQKSIGQNPTFFESLTLSLMKMDTNIRSLPVKELSNSATLFFLITNVYMNALKYHMTNIIAKVYQHLRLSEQKT